MTQQACLNVLIIEDEPAIRDALSQILEDEGYSVASVANGQEAIAYLRTHTQPCLILLDLMMPVMNGWQFRSAQQADPALATIPTVVISADSSLLNQPKPIDAMGYIRKPIPLDLLLDTVEQYCA